MYFAMSNIESRQNGGGGGQPGWRYGGGLGIKRLM
jgi:hypothetical protein